MKRMRLLLAVIGAVASMSCLYSVAIAATPTKPLTVAVFGDWPYTTVIAKAPQLLTSVNTDPDVRLVIHVGDIHSGSQPCTGAGLNPIPADSNPTYNQTIFNIFQQFTDPFVYTPGDNEWTDCHKTKEFSSGAPLNELAAVRSLFFPNPGMALGSAGTEGKEVDSQANEFEGEFPTDGQFVENVMWRQSQVVFVTLNIPGSNNDGLPWSGSFLNEDARKKEVTERNAANLRWLDRAFHDGKKAAAMVIALQANMWDPEALATGGDGLNNYDPFVQALANHAVAFGRPVLLFNGDSHVYGTDHPLADAGSATGLIHQTQAVPNLTRITVQGSTNTPNEWIKLRIDPSSADVFTWSNVPY